MTIVQPSLNLNFRPEFVPAILTVTRASAAYRRNRFGLLESVASDVLRHDFDPSTLSYRGVLIEGAGTNLDTASEDHTAASWATSIGIGTISADAVAAPDGTTTAETVPEDSSNGEHYQEKTYTGLTGTTTYCYSRFVKAAGRTKFRLRFASGASTGQAVFDTEALTAAESSSGVLASWGIEKHPAGWYRIWASMAVPSGSTSLKARVFTVTDFSSNLYQGDGSSGHHAWGSQFEATTYPTSYIKTSGSSATRAVDVATINSSAGWWRAAEGTILVEFDDVRDVGANSFLLHLDDGTTNNRIMIYENASKNIIGGVQAGGVEQISDASAAKRSRAHNKVAITWSESGDLYFCANGATPVGDTGNSIPAVTNFRVGNNSVANGAWNGPVQRVAFFPAYMTNSELQEVTAI